MPVCVCECVPSSGQAHQIFCCIRFSALEQSRDLISSSVVVVVIVVIVVVVFVIVAGFPFPWHVEAGKKSQATRRDVNSRCNIHVCI